MPTYACAACNAPFYASPSQAAKRKHCSRTCSMRGETLPCAVCDRSFYVPAARLRQGKAKCCSVACATAWQGRNKVEKECVTCSSVFRRSASLAGARARFCSIPCRDRDPEVRAALVERNEQMQQAGKVTATERRGYALLDDLGVDYERQVLFNGKFTPDATIEAAKMLVQFDGDYWHDRQGTSTEPRIRRRVALDQSQDKYARACGWTVVRLWESDLKADPQGCLQHLADALASTLRGDRERDGARWSTLHRARATIDA